MAREGTRSQTGNSKPRIFPVVDTAPVTHRKRSTKPKTAAAPKASKPTGVTKKKSPSKEGDAAKKVKSAVKKAEKKVEGKTVETKKEAKPEKPKTKAKTKAAAK